MRLPICSRRSRGRTRTCVGSMACKGLITRPETLTCIKTHSSGSIGSRAYPLRLQCFKFKEKTASISLQWKPPRGTQEPIPARNLSPSNSSPTFVVTTPFPPDDSSLGYERGMLVSKAWDEAATSAAIEVANYVVEHLDQLSHSKQDETNRITKLEAFCMELVTTAWRKPLTQQQS